MTRRKAEVEAFVARLNERDKKIGEIDRQMADLRGDKTRFETSFNIAKDRNEQMRKEIESLKIENAELRSQAAAGSTQPGAPGQRVVPPEDVRGTVKRIDGELATISVGSDAGVNVGNSLKVYRLYPPDYLGELTIMAATPQQAVGRISGPRSRRFASATRWRWTFSAASDRVGTDGTIRGKGPWTGRESTRTPGRRATCTPACWRSRWWRWWRRA